MKKLIVVATLILNANLAGAWVCGRFSAPAQSMLQRTVEIEFNYNRVTQVPSRCFHYEPRGVRCDLTYDGQAYFFFFNEKFSKVDVNSGVVESYFKHWLKANDGKMVVLKSYNTVFIWENDYEEEGCDLSYEQQTSTLTIEGKESIILQ